MAFEIETICESLSSNVLQDLELATALVGELALFYVWKAVIFSGGRKPEVGPSAGEIGRLVALVKNLFGVCGGHFCAVNCIETHALVLQSELGGVLNFGFHGLDRHGENYQHFHSLAKLNPKQFVGGPTGHKGGH